MTITGTDLRPIKERQDEVDALMRKELPAEHYEGVRKFMLHGRLFFMIAPLIMKRELWEKFWTTFRDSVEIEAEQALTESEKPKQERGIFG